MGPYPERRRYSETTAREIDCAVRTLVHDAFEQASAVLSKHRGVLESSAKELLEKETLSAADLPVVEPWT